MELEFFSALFPSMSAQMFGLSADGTFFILKRVVAPLKVNAQHTFVYVQDLTTDFSHFIQEGPTHSQNSCGVFPPVPDLKP